jgi:hypothetical protein
MKISFKGDYTVNETTLLKKNGQAIINIAKAFLEINIDTRMDSIPKYAEKFELSVGTIQKAIKFLEDEKMVTLERKGHLGTVVKSIKYEKLLNYAGISTIVCVMPLPYSKRYEGLATGLKQCFADKNIPFYFAHMGGAGIRINFLEKGLYDFAIISKLAAEQAIKSGQKIEIAFEFGKNTYVSSHVLFKRDNITIKKVGIDPNSQDQCLLTTDHFKDNNDIEMVKINYNKIPELLKRGIIDATVWNLDEIEEQNMKINYDELENKALVNLANEAVLIVKQNDSALKNIAGKVINKNHILQMQKDILNDKIYPSY